MTMQLSTEDISVAKAMLQRGDKAHDIAAHFGVNAGRIAEIKTGLLGPSIKAADASKVPPIVTARAGRFIDPNAPLETQIAQLQAFISQPPADSRRLKFTPALAEWVLTNLNPKNRPRRSRDIKRFAEDMVSGRWFMTGDTIKFNRSGELSDGQHRLAACMRAQVPFESYVVFGVPDAAFIVMDTGRKRTSDDTFYVAGVPNAFVTAGAVRWVKILGSEKPTERSISFTNSELLAAYNALDTHRLDDCVRAAIAASKGRRAMHASSFAALLFMFMGRNEAAADAFSREVRTCTRNGLKLLNKLEKIAKSNMGRVHENQRNALTILAFNACAAGRVILDGELRWDEGNDLPAIA
jgi:hypothetical protein